MGAQALRWLDTWLMKQDTISMSQTAISHYMQLYAMYTVEQDRKGARYLTIYTIIYPSLFHWW